MWYLQNSSTRKNLQKSGKSYYIDKSKRQLVTFCSQLDGASSRGNKILNKASKIIKSN